ncbi:hypothetical protein C6N75_09935 [Streptomyces solincola]|uniref:Uncharacterized protein n=1 Tax=Streptomyces solincola TaxID=2100817 RepID=A0A2S9PYG0_9ACTN|nr:hypothetical protein [Streptomyces solincola]PRH79393.1 hypothetical protein C6N75_09935 [Streptomyces solincola]
MSDFKLVVQQEDTELWVDYPVNALTLSQGGQQGPPGPPGVPGAPGGFVYEHTQSVAAATWVINHNIGRRVHVSVFDSSGRQVETDVEHGTTNQTSVIFATPTTGSAVIS